MLACTSKAIMFASEDTPVFKNKTPAVTGVLKVKRLFGFTLYLFAESWMWSIGL